MRHGSLFSGIGGFDLAAEWMGWENVFHCEWMEFPRKVLEYHFPNADSHTDITKTDFKPYANTIDILTGGFPCQPFSTAGKRKGTDDERYLWHEMLRAIQEIKPQFVIAENVFGIVNIDGGLVFEQVCLDLENEGYEVQPFIIPAVAKNAPHRRDRCWFVAYSISDANGLRTKRWLDMDGKLLERRKRKETTNRFNDISKNGNATNTDSRGLEGSVEVGRNCEYVIGENGTSSQTRNATNTSKSANELQGKGGLDLDGVILEKRKGQKKTNRFNSNNSKNAWHDFPTQSPICGGDDGLPTKLDGITFSKWRAESIKGYGNAIVPQVAYELFKQIELWKQYTNNTTT
jgi:DNA (cytosine-5)-methyltransferase 1